MKQASFHFSSELDVFLIHDHRGRTFPINFRGRQSVKHLIEALGVPHTQIGHILANGNNVSFDYLVQNGDSIDIFPATGNDSGLWGLGNEEMDNFRFLLDNHLGKLAIYLRIMGFDTLYRNDFQDDELLDLYEQEDRVLLTRDRGLLKNKIIQRGYWVRSLDPKQQALEIITRFNLKSRMNPFKRCLHCNAILQPVDKASIIQRLLPLTRKYYDDFSICPECDQIYWKGSHYEHMLNFLQELEG